MLKARRAFLGLRQEDAFEVTRPLVDADEKALTQSNISDVETGRVHPLDMGTLKSGLLLHFLRWTPAQFEKEAAITLPGFIPQVDTFSPEVAARKASYLENVKPIALMRTLSAGPGGDDGEVIGYVTIPADWEGEHCAYEVDGSSMEPDIPHGSIVIARMQTHAELGQTVVAYCDDRGMVVKELKITNEVQRKAIFSSKNPKYAPILIGEGCRILGKVVEVRRRLN
jgi:SOS-response transcriptional repressor LexA